MRYNNDSKVTVTVGWWYRCSYHVMCTLLDCAQCTDFPGTIVRCRKEHSSGSVPGVWYITKLRKRRKYMLHVTTVKIYICMSVLFDLVLNLNSACLYISMCRDGLYCSTLAIMDTVKLPSSYLIKMETKLSRQRYSLHRLLRDLYTHM